MPTRHDGSSVAITAAIVTYGERTGMLARVVEAALDAGAERVHVVFNGNGEQEPILRALLPGSSQDRLTSTLLAENLGSAGGFRTVIARCRAFESDYVWILDDDNQPRPDALALLVGSVLALDPRTCHVSLRVTDFYQSQIMSGRPASEVFPSAGQFLNNDVRRRLARRRDPSSTPPRSPFAVPVAPYGGLLASREALADTPLPRAEFYLYEDDTEWTRRITQGGFRIYLHPTSRVDDLDGKWAGHEHTSATDGLLASTDTTRLYYSIRNRTYLDSEMASTAGFRVRCIFTINQILYCAVLLAKGMRRGRMASTCTILRAVLAGTRGVFGDPR
ncbi:glycosyltransferase [Rathayibacter caricis]|uniref:glycosyltransferase n=1 Tax=Rathayibacter caricis TaxID=110936 RepID=UPI001FB36915|nr:glycosyltransferase [Rathayibacter caricis]MCJ1694908.1 glycosyltransferase [Rathayibacter caricis]